MSKSPLSVKELESLASAAAVFHSRLEECVEAGDTLGFTKMESAYEFIDSIMDIGMYATYTIEDKEEEANSLKEAIKKQEEALAIMRKQLKDLS